MIEHASPARMLVRGAALAASLVVLSTAACSESTGVDRDMATGLGFSTASNTASSASRTVVPITKDGHTLDVTEATIVVTRASLKKTSSDVCRSDDEDDDDDFFDRHRGNCGEVKVGPTFVDLPLDGKVITIPGNTLPPGTYREIAVRVSLVRLEGTFDGKAFDVTIPVYTTTEIDFETPLVVAADSAVAVTVNLPVDTWLVRNDGTLVDPTKISSTPSLMAL